MRSATVTFTGILPAIALFAMVSPAFAQSRYPAEATVDGVNYRADFTEANPNLFSCSQQQYTVVGQKSVELVAEYGPQSRRQWEESGAAALNQPLPDLHFYFQCFPDGTIQIGPLSDVDGWIPTFGYRPQWGIIEPGQ